MAEATTQTAKALIRILHPDSASAVQKRKKAGTTNMLIQTKNVLENGAALGTAQGEEKQVISVQYNPSSLRITQQVREQADNAGEGLDRETNVAGNCTRMLEVELVFAGVDKAAPDIVQNRVEAFLTLMMRSPDRRITFSWGKLECTGCVSSMNASYDMFDGLGNPLVGRVGLTIREDAEDVSGAFEKADCRAGI